MDKQHIRTIIRDFILRELIRDPHYALADNEGLITSGLMDSFALAEFGVFVEQEFDVYIPDPELTVARLDTIEQMVARVSEGLTR